MTSDTFSCEFSKIGPNMKKDTLLSVTKQTQHSCETTPFYILKLEPVERDETKLSDFWPMATTALQAQLCCAAAIPSKDAAV